MRTRRERSHQAGHIRIGTRGSDLAIWQARYVRERLHQLGVGSDLVVVKTRGDIITDVPLAQLEGKRFFTKELEDAQLDGRVDLAVHSLKDLATEMPDGLTIAALIGREDPRDLLLARSEAVDPQRQAAGDLLPIRLEARIGTSATRRQIQLRELRPDLEIADLRGNVPTRIERLRNGPYDAIILALAGARRLELDLSDLFSKPLDLEQFVPAPGQGMLAIQCRDEPSLVESLRALHCEDASRAVKGERRLLEHLDGGCQLPFGVNVRPVGGEYRMVVFWGQGTNTGGTLRFAVEGPDPLVLAADAYERITAVSERDVS